MFKIIKKVSDSTLLELTQHCTDLIPRMTPDVSNYAKGRYRLWLFHEALLTKKRVIPAYFDERLWQFCQRIYPGSNIALLTFGGEAHGIKSNGKILPHRDDTYAQELAYGVNFGASATFGYNTDRRGNNFTDTTVEYYHLEPGTIYHFNCKHQHAVVEHKPGRFSLNIWTIRTNLDKSPGFALAPNIATLLPK